MKINGLGIIKIIKLMKNKNGRKEKVEEKVACITKEEKTKRIELATLI